MYTQPLKGVVEAANEGNQRQLQKRASDFARKAQELSEIAETVATNTRNQEVAR